MNDLGTSNWEVEVDVALSRPPHADKTLFFVFADIGELDPQIFACHWAASQPGVKMVVGARIVSWPCLFGRT